MSAGPFRTNSFRRSSVLVVSILMSCVLTPSVRGQDHVGVVSEAAHAFVVGRGEAKIADPVFVGDEFLIGKDGGLTVQFKDGRVLSLKPGSLAKIDMDDASTASLVRLYSGDLEWLEGTSGVPTTGAQDEIAEKMQGVAVSPTDVVSVTSEEPQSPGPPSDDPAGGDLGDDNSEPGYPPSGPPPEGKVADTNVGTGGGTGTAREIVVDALGRVPHSDNTHVAGGGAGGAGHEALDALAGTGAMRELGAGMAAQDLTPGAVQDLTQATVQDLGQATVQDLGQATVQDLGQATVQDLTQATVQDLTQATVQDLTRATVQDLTQATVQDLTQATVQDLTQATVQDLTQATVQDLTRATVQDLNQATVQDLNQATVQDLNQATVRELSR